MISVLVEEGAFNALNFFTFFTIEIDGRYPNPFLDPVNGGYGTVALYSVGILVLFMATCWVTATVGTGLRARRADD